MNIRILIAAGAAATVLAACTGGSSTEGIEAIVSAIPQATRTLAADEHEVTFRRGDGLRIDLQLGLFNLVPTELEPCGADLARLLRRLDPIGTASAHGAGEELPATLVSVVGDEVAAGFGLGEIGAEPGTYCALVVEIQPGGAEEGKHGGTLDESMDGALVNVAPCYYPGTDSDEVSDADALAATEHHCIQAKALGEERAVRLPFAHPVTLDRDHRTLGLTVFARYEKWFDGLDFETLATDADQQALLADNVAAALQVEILD